MSAEYIFDFDIVRSEGCDGCDVTEEDIGIFSDVLLGKVGEELGAVTMRMACRGKCTNDLGEVICNYSLEGSYYDKELNKSGVFYTSNAPND